MVDERVADKLNSLPDEADLNTIIKSVREALSAEQHSVDTAQDARIARLEQQVGRLQLYVSVLLYITKTRGLVSKSDFTTLINLADLEDGIRDGMRAGDPLE